MLASSRFEFSLSRQGQLSSGALWSCLYLLSNYPFFPSFITMIGRALLSVPAAVFCDAVWCGYWYSHIILPSLGTFWVDVSSNEVLIWSNVNFIIAANWKLHMVTWSRRTCFKEAEFWTLVKPQHLQLKSSCSTHRVLSCSQWARRVMIEMYQFHKIIWTASGF